MIISTSISTAAGPESELSKLIRYGCQFELEIHQMAELSQMRAENKRLRRNAQSKSPDSGAGE